MIWLYRLQQRLSITRNEGIALVTLAALFMTGLVVRHVRQQQAPPLTADSLVQRTDGAVEARPQGQGPTSPAPTPDDPLAINDASAQELQRLDGIGPALSERIVEYRRRQRPFQRPEELKRVRGIGPKTMADLRSLITVSSDPE